MHKVIFFDAGGTLFRPWPSVGDVYARVASQHGVLVDALHVEKAFHEKWHLRNGLAGLGQTSEKIERDWWYQLVQDIFHSVKPCPHPPPLKRWRAGGPLPRAAGEGEEQIYTLARRRREREGVRAGPFKDFDAFFHELYDLFARAECWRLFEDTVPALESLKSAGYRLAIISNWDQRLFSIVEQLGLQRYFEHVTASAVVGTAKPGRAIFAAALKAMQADAAQGVHVGDSLSDDYQGAQQAGLTPVLIDRSERAYNGITRVKSLLELSAGIRG